MKFRLSTFCSRIECGTIEKFILPNRFDVMTEGRAMIDTAIKYGKPEFLRLIVERMIANLPAEGTKERSEKVEDISDFIDDTIEEFKSKGIKISDEIMEVLAFFISEKDPQEMSEEELDKYLEGCEAEKPAAAAADEHESKEAEHTILGSAPEYEDG